MEIERKFLLPSMPVWHPHIEKAEKIRQGYLLVDDVEVRVRQKGERFYFTIKGDGAMERDEWETEILENIFEILWPKTEGVRIEKTRYSIPFRNLILEVDEYKGKLDGLVILECEFSNKEDAESFVLPSWAKSAVDVTENKAFKNKNLAVYGLPT